MDLRADRAPEGEARPIAFADELEKIDPRENCDVLLSLERVWRCDVYRAGRRRSSRLAGRRDEIAGRCKDSAAS